MSVGICLNNIMNARRFIAITGESEICRIETLIDIRILIYRSVEHLSLDLSANALTFGRGMFRTVNSKLHEV